ncbi:MAG: hypothetical protein KBD12_02640 [Candidatus Pacebacteria bacterium]|nr:hypothetical protein [Candidatus Paceibacterota bacterium]
MKKETFQRLISAIMIFIVIFIDIPSVFKDLLIIILSLVFLFSTFNFLKKKKEEENSL